MNSNPSQAAAAATVEPPLAARVAALELFAQQLVFVLDAQGKLNAEALMRWMTLARERMQATGSVPPPQVHALARLQALLEQ